MEVYKFLMFFITFSSITAFIVPNDLTDLKKYSNLTSAVQYGDNLCQKEECTSVNCNCCPGYIPMRTSYSTGTCFKCNCGELYSCEFRGPTRIKVCHCPDGYREVHGVCKVKECDKEDCTLNLNCDCCPGYIFKRTGYSTGTCEKCNCGEDYGCEFQGLTVRRKICHCPPTYRDISGTCREKCTLITCENGGTCTIKEDNAVCLCLEGYTGQYCETNKCSKITCRNNGKCIIKNENAVCDCTEEYTGESCQTHKCSLVKCYNNGNCIMQGGKTVCRCPVEYTGEYCQTSKCSQITCHNNGKCVIKDEKAVCQCPELYW